MVGEHHRLGHGVIELGALAARAVDDVQWVERLFTDFVGREEVVGPRLAAEVDRAGQFGGIADAAVHSLKMMLDPGALRLTSMIS